MFLGENIPELIVEVLEAFGHALKVRFNITLQYEYVLLYLQSWIFLIYSVVSLLSQKHGSFSVDLTKQK